MPMSYVFSVLTIVCHMFKMSSQSCDFVKKRDDTVLRIVWNGNLRLIDRGPKSGSAHRWFFTINGKECSVPKTIDTQLYVRDSDTNNHRPAYGGHAVYTCYTEKTYTFERLCFT